LSGVYRDLVDGYFDEVLSAEVYGFLAESSRGVERDLFRALASMEGRHASILAGVLERKGFKPPAMPFSLRMRVKLLKALSRLLGYRLLMLLMERSEVEAILGYSRLLEDPGLSDARGELLELLRDEVVHEVELYERIHGFRIEVENMKDAVYGMIDALVEIEAGVIGIATATQPLIAGVAGLISSIAGAISMSVGAYLSTKSENEAARSEEVANRVTASVDRDRFLEKVQRRLIEAGLGEDRAREVVEAASGNPGLLELLVKQGSQESSPTSAARSAGVFYILGALGPITPFLLNLPAHLSIPLSIGLTLLVLLLLTVFIALTSGGRILKLFTEYAGLTLAATAVTYVLGSVIKTYFGLGT